MKPAVFIATVALVSACGSDDADEVSVRDEGGTVGAEIASDYNRQMNRARDVEVQLEQHKRSLDEAIEKQTNPDR